MEILFAFLEISVCRAENRSVVVVKQTSSGQLLSAACQDAQLPLQTPTKKVTPKLQRLFSQHHQTSPPTTAAELFAHGQLLKHLVVLYFLAV